MGTDGSHEKEVVIRNLQFQFTISNIEPLTETRLFTNNNRELNIVDCELKKT